MRPGSVIVDLAAETGGNCELTDPGKVVNKHGVSIVGYSDLPSRLAQTASQLYGNNLNHFLTDLGGAEGFHVDLEDDVVRGAVVMHHGELMWPPPKPKHPPEPAKPKEEPTRVAPPKPSEQELQRKRGVRSGIVLALMALVFALLGGKAPEEFLSHLTVFVLACFVGWQVVWNVTPALHTPLMSVTNAISGIIIVGGMLQISGPTDSLVTILGALAILLATINIAGGFLVTQRMLKMFQK
jgi:NAD(P) transhydrogenase subunit alpha